jgi:hypothetical protein
MLNIEVTHNSKVLALASSRDSTAMKTVSILSIVFLLGALLAVSPARLQFLLPRLITKNFSPCLRCPSLTGKPAQKITLLDKGEVFKKELCKNIRPV